MTSVAVWFSSFSSPFLSGLFSLGIFVVGRSVPDLRQLAARLGGPTGLILELCAAFLPNLQLFYPSGTSVDGKTVSVHASFVAAPYLASATAYALGYSALVLGLAMLIFRRRDFV
jgi:hypothetical protein